MKQACRVWLPTYSSWPQGYWTFACTATVSEQESLEFSSTFIVLPFQLSSRNHAAQGPLGSTVSA